MCVRGMDLNLFKETYVKPLPLHVSILPSRLRLGKFSFSPFPLFLFGPLFLSSRLAISLPLRAKFCKTKITGTRFAGEPYNCRFL